MARLTKDEHRAVRLNVESIRADMKLALVKLPVELDFEDPTMAATMEHIENANRRLDLILDHLGIQAVTP